MLEEFTRQVLDTLKQMLPDCDLTVQQVNKPGENRLTGICIRSEKSNVAPILYMEQPYQMFCEGTPINDICNQLRRVYEQNCMTDNFDTAILTDWSKVSDRVCAKLINFNRNREYLQDKVFMVIPTTDIVVMYYVDLDTVSDGATVPVSKQLFDAWNIDTETLHQHAMQNTQRIHNPSVRPLNAVMTEVLHATDEELAGIDAPCMYVITSQKMINGAILALLPDVQAQLQEALGDYFLLPSSTEEMLAVPRSLQSPDMLLAMVTEINHTQVLPADQLSDDVYIIQNGQLISVFTDEEKQVLRRKALCWLPFPEVELAT